jgi:hypothetical protein
MTPSTGSRSGDHEAAQPPPQPGLQVEPIDVLDGKHVMPVATIMSVPPALATIWTRSATRLILVVEFHPEVAGFGAASASWSARPICIRGDHNGTMVRPDLGWWSSVRWVGLLGLEHGVGAF